MVKIETYFRAAQNKTEEMTRIRKNLILKKETVECAEERRKEQGRSFNNYIENLINEDCVAAISVHQMNHLGKPKKSK